MRLFEWILETTWQASVLALLILAVHAIGGKRISPKWRYSLWFLLVARLMLPTLPESPTSIFNFTRLETFGIGVGVNPGRLGQSMAGGSAALQLSETHPAPVERVASPGGVVAIAPEQRNSLMPPAPSVTWKRLMLYLWIGGVCFFLLRLIWTNLHFVRAIKFATHVSDSSILPLLEDCRSRLAVKESVLLLETNSVNTPCIYGFWQKKLLLPENFLDRFSPDEIRDIFSHELAHVRRRDIETNWLVAILQAFHWFNPVLWFAFARMRADREIATDALALGAPWIRSNEAYGETILKVLAGFNSRSKIPQVVGIIESKARMKERLRAIARHGLVRPYSGLSFSLSLALACFTLTGAVDQNKPESGKPNSLNQSASSPNNIFERTPAKKQFLVETVDFDNQSPIEGVTVRLEMEDYAGNSVTKTITTGKDGRASTEIPSEGLKSLSYITEHPELLSLNSTWRHQQIPHTPSPLKIKMSKGIEIGGTVLNRSGKPLNEAQVFFNSPLNYILESRAHSHDIRWSVAAGELIGNTDAQGRWRARRIWPTASLAHIRVRHPNFADEIFSTDLAESKNPARPGRWMPWTSLTNNSATFHLDEGISVKGRVVSESGTPIAGILVRYSDHKTSRETESMGSAIILTDSDGRFHIAHLPKKQLYFTVQVPEFAPAVADFDPSSKSDDLQIRLTKGRPLKGVVKDMRGTPVPGVKMRFADWGIWQGIEWETTTDAEGKFFWENAPESKFAFLLNKEGFIPAQKILQGGEDKEIRFNPALRLAGEVRDGETKEIIPAFRLSWSDRPEDFAYSRSLAMNGTNGFYALDLSRIHADSWADNYYHSFIIRIEADGYEPVKSRTFESRNNDVGDLQQDFFLSPGRIKGRVVDASEQPVSGAQIALKTAAVRLRLAGKPRFKDLDKISFPETSPEGSFVISRDPEATHLIVVHEKGFGLIEAKELKEDVKIKLQPWARIEGVVTEYGTPLPNQQVVLTSGLLNSAPHHSITFLHMETDSDGTGHYKLEYVPPTRVSIYRMSKHANGAYSSPYQHVELTPGSTVKMNIGESGRPVLGRFRIRNPYVQVDWRRAQSHASTTRPKPPESIKTREEYELWSKQPDIQLTIQEFKSYPMRIATNGSFRIEEMLPGKYDMGVSIYDPRDRDAFSHGKYIARFNSSFEIPPSALTDHTPFDLGEFEIELQGEPGKKTAPDFTASDFNGKPVNLSDFRGKYVLLDFWASWCSPCIAEIPYIQRAHERFSQRDDFLIIGLSMDKTIGDAQQFAQKNKLPGLQLYLPQNIRADVQSQYQFQGIPAKFLIDPEGKIIEEKIEAVSLLMQLDSLLGKR